MSEYIRANKLDTYKCLFQGLEQFPKFAGGFRNMREIHFSNCRVVTDDQKVKIQPMQHLHFTPPHRAQRCSKIVIIIIAQTIQHNVAL